MFIQTQSTPNPDTLRFVPGVTVLPEGQTANFTSADAAGRSPLAQALFRVPEVTGVYLGHDFVSVSKQASAEWSLMKPALLTTIMEHFVAELPTLLQDGETLPDANAIRDDDPELVKQIKEIIEMRVRPAVAQDGGDIIFHSFEEGIVRLEMRGACAGCPSSTATLKSGIENMLRHYIPEVVAVEAV